VPNPGHGHGRGGVGDTLIININNVEIAEKLMLLPAATSVHSAITLAKAVFTARKDVTSMAAVPPAANLTNFKKVQGGPTPIGTRAQTAQGGRPVLDNTCAPVHQSCSQCDATDHFVRCCPTNRPLEAVQPPPARPCPGLAARWAEFDSDKSAANYAEGGEVASPCSSSCPWPCGWPWRGGRTRRWCASSRTQGPTCPASHRRRRPDCVLARDTCAPRPYAHHSVQMGHGPG
jgi:hypothetical protein